ncbi:hypothetical protein WN48_09006 [Eufriesea mexicana]|uniref:uncharacterized protein LOC108546025 n=1 Tax=Eufriesea mexicana TaxID=516756 RepID=UPI00083C1907|nr:PREDICTED: uncharacterized protein LOC108546025 [Eufriesea mexicana]OAD59484.1 hypothetical protein WN48_09006 [Eufriesea mexicana]
MKYSSKFLFILIHLFVIILIVDCEDESYFEDTINDEEFINPHSFFFDKQSKTMIEDIEVNSVKDVAEYSIVARNNLKSYNQINNCNSHEAIFYQRLINLLLSNVYIQNQNDVSITGVLEISISHSQIETLRNFHTHKMSLREVDEILSNIIKKPKNYYTFGVKHISGMLYKAFHSILKILQDHPDGFLILSVMIMVGLTFRKIAQGHRLPIFGLIQIILLLSFFITWWQLIKEAEIKSTAEQIKFSKIPISCEPDKMNMWDKIVAFFYGDDCEQYYRTMMSNPKLKITPALALSHFVSTVIFHPITHIGTVISVFISNVTDNLPWTYRWIIICMLFLCIGSVIIMIPLILCGASFNLGLSGFGISFAQTNRTGNSLENVQKRDPVQVILQPRSVTNALPMEDILKTTQLNTLQVLKKCCEEEVAVMDNNSKEDCDLCCGDTVENNKLSKHNDEEIEKCKIIGAVKIEKDNGRGDR